MNLPYTAISSSHHGHATCARQKRRFGTSIRHSNSPGRLYFAESFPSQQIPEWNRIGFFAGILLLSLLYIFSDTRFQAEQESVRAESEMRYYLKEENGTVSVYSGETQELFEKTSIPFRKLPVEIQTEIRQGKSFSGEEELFDFLENYSS